MASLSSVTVTMVVAPVSNIAAAFAEWHRRWTEEPARFQAEAESLATPNQTYGESCAAYLLKILGEQESAAATPPAS